MVLLWHVFTSLNWWWLVYGWFITNLTTIWNLSISIRERSFSKNSGARYGKIKFISSPFEVCLPLLSQTRYCVYSSAILTQFSTWTPGCKLCIIAVSSTKRYWYGVFNCLSNIRAMRQWSEGSLVWGTLLSFLQVHSGRNDSLNPDRMVQVGFNFPFPYQQTFKS